MSKNTRTKEKRKKHREYVNRLSKQFSKDVLVNKSLNPDELKNEVQVEPYKFVVTIKDKTGISIISVDINGVIKYSGDFNHDNDETVCKIDALVATPTFYLIIKAKGTNNLTTTFNLTCDGDKVYDEDKEIKIEADGNGGFTDMNVPLP